MGKINIEIPEELHKKLKLYCILNNITIADFIKSALEDFLKEEK